MLAASISIRELFNGFGLKANAYCREGFEIFKKLRELEKEGKANKISSIAEVFQAFVMSPKAVEGDKSRNALPYYSASELIKTSPVPKYFLMDIDPRLEKWKVGRGFILLTASGSVGRPIYPREEFGDPFLVWGDMIRIKPTGVPSGYLYAYLSSQLFQSVLKIMEIGSVIQHLDPVQVGDIPIPITSKEVMEEIHDLVEEASGFRTKAGQKERLAKSMLEQEFSKWQD